MNTMQIKCFLKVVETLNFTKAASKLYISQPGLSRQIVSLEKELDTTLFIRDNRNVKLTPAAIVLAEELKNFEIRHDKLIEKVKRAGKGYSGRLVIGSLSGQFLGEDFTERYLEFTKANPDIDVFMQQGSFGDLRKWVEDDKIDIALTLKFDILEMQNIVVQDFHEEAPCLAYSKKTALGKKKNITDKDLEKETFISISPEDSPVASSTYDFLVKGGTYKFADVKYAPNLATANMWIEAGLGVGLINESAVIATQPSIAVLKNRYPAHAQEAYSCFIWKKDNYNPAISIFSSFFPNNQ